MAEFRPFFSIADVNNREVISMNGEYDSFESALEGLKDIKERLTDISMDLKLYEEEGLLSYGYYDKTLAEGYYLICTVMPAKIAWISV